MFLRSSFGWLCVLITAMGTPTETPLPRDLAAQSGVVRAARRARLSAEIAGRIEVRPREEHDFVRKDELLLGIEAQPYDAELKAAEADLLDAEAERDLAQRDLERTRELLRRDVSSDRDLDAAETRILRARAAVLRAEARRDLAKFRRTRCRIAAPFAGAINELMVEEGEYVRIGDPLASVLDISAVEIETFVDAATLATLRAGQPVNLREFPKCSAKIRSLAPGSDNPARSFKVVIVAENPAPPAPPLLRPGMLVHWTLRP
jgi:membrane fusion protein, multidrug efflux system